MSDLLDLDIEDAIPANQIMARKSQDCEEEITDDKSFLDENAIIMEEETEDDEVEYVEVTYLDDEFEYDEIIKEEPVSDTEMEQEIENETEISEEKPDTNVVQEQQEQELYFCDSCNMHFTSVASHLQKFHQNQQVMLGSNIANEQLNGIIDSIHEIKTEYINEEDLDDIIEEDVPVEYFVGTESCDSTQNEEDAMRDMESIKQEILSSNVQMTEVHGFEDENETIFLKEAQDDTSQDQTEYTHLKYKRKPKTKLSSDDSTLCTECNTTFPTVKSLKLHMRMHGPIKVKHLEDAVSHELKACTKDKNVKNETFFCEECNKSYDKQFEEIHLKVHIAGSTFTCTVCNKKFANQINLDMHLQAHQDHAKLKGPTKADKNGVNFPYPCVYCGRKFSRPHEKVKHERIHTGEKPYKCEICGKCFRVSYCLTLHLRTHTGARPYVCPHCNKRFKAYSVYNHHLMTHSDERPYKCPYCPKAFKTSVQLGGHKNSHTKPFSCPECNRPFASLYSVKAHMETHKRGSQNLKHRCSICGAIYARMFALRDHMKEQHPEEKFTPELTETESVKLPHLEGAVNCSECNEKFSSIYLLKSHMETHEKRKHVCKTCRASYNSRYALKDHMKKFHGLLQTEEEAACTSPFTIVSDIELNNENGTAAQSIIADGEEITLSSIENFQSEEIVTDLNYL